MGAGNVTIDSNLILGNHAQGGNGGGIRLQQVNGADLSNQAQKGLWQVKVTNNMIVNNVAGYAGGGISLLETTNSYIINNTVASNDSTATAGIAFPNRSQQSSAQPAGISSEPHGAAFPRYAQTGSFSDPVLNDNIVYKNRSFYFLAQPATRLRLRQHTCTSGAQPTRLRSSTVTTRARRPRAPKATSGTWESWVIRARLRNESSASAILAAEQSGPVRRNEHRR